MIMRTEPFIYIPYFGSEQQSKTEYIPKVVAQDIFEHIDLNP